MSKKIARLSCLILLALFCVGVAFAATPRKLQVGLYGGDTSPGAPLAPWYRSIGITDVWLFPVQGAFPQDQLPQDQSSPAKLKKTGTLAAYRKNNIRYWWLERPAPGILFEQAKGEGVNLWDSDVKNDRHWAAVCARIKSIYPIVRRVGFEGLAYDTEGYYSGSDVIYENAKQYGENGNYYKRGLQIGKAIASVWPKAKVICVYAFGYEGERWFYKGIQDGGTDFYIGDEHTYGAGDGKLFAKPAWYQMWWRGVKTKECCDWKRTKLDSIADNQHVWAGLFPIDLSTGSVSYSAKFFREQLESAANEDPKGPIPVWIYPQGAFTPENVAKIKYAPGETAESYWSVLREYSSQGGNNPPNKGQEK